MQLNFTLADADWPLLTLFDLDFLVCELRKTLILKWNSGACTPPKAGFFWFDLSRAHQELAGSEVSRGPVLPPITSRRLPILGSADRSGRRRAGQNRRAKVC
jgi:hypothetical protein